MPPMPRPVTHSSGVTHQAASGRGTVADPYTPQVEPLGAPGVARQMAAGTISSSVALSAACRRISIFARGADIRYLIGAGPLTANASSSHFIAQNERLDLRVPEGGGSVAVIRDIAATTNGVLEVSELDG